MRALLSVSDREGIVELAKGLTDAGAELFATDGTRTHLTEAGIEGIRPVCELTETNEILGGRVKTLHPKIFAALLARRDQPDHLAQLAEQSIELIDIVVVNLYPFAQTVRQPSDDAWTRRSSRSTSAAWRSCVPRRRTSRAWRRSRARRSTHRSFAI